MSGAALQALYDLGYAQSAAVLGTPYAQYRANGANNPTADGNLVATINAWLTTDAKLMGTAQPQYGKPGWYGAFERSGALVGDYLIGQNGTFFIASLDYPAAPFLTWCNHTVQIARAADTLAAGSTGTYSGTAVNSAEPFMVGWPCSILQMSSGSKMSGTGMKLPSDGKLPGAAVLLPGSCPAIRFNDIITDETGVRYAVSSSELTPLGWRLTAEQWPSA